MKSRLWLYLSSAVIVAILLSVAVGLEAKINDSIKTKNQQSLDNEKTEMTQYLAKQTDPFKLVSLAKKLIIINPPLVQLVADKAYELNPNRRDIVLLDSQFHPELKSKLTVIDPLYPEN